jgi:hypothetical protein
VTARYGGIILHSLHPSNISAEQGARRGGAGGHNGEKEQSAGGPPISRHTAAKCISLIG